MAAHKVNSDSLRFSLFSLHGVLPYQFLDTFQCTWIAYIHPRFRSYLCRDSRYCYRIDKALRKAAQRKAEITKIKPQKESRTAIALQTPDKGKIPTSQ